MRYLLFHMFLLVSLKGYTQQYDSTSVRLLLKDGSKLRGSMIQDYDYRVKIRLGVGDTMNLEWADIHRMHRFHGLLVKHPRGLYHELSGGYFDMAMSISAGYTGAVHFHLGYGYRISPQVSYKVGMGLDAFTGSLDYRTFSFLSPNIGIRYYPGPRRKPINGYLEGRLGWGIRESFVSSFFADGQYQGGMMANPIFGLHLPSKGSVKWHFAISTHIQYMTAEYSTFNAWSSFVNPNLVSGGDPRLIFVKERTWFIRSAFRIGIEF